jgi:hypothetical protein
VNFRVDPEIMSAQLPSPFEPKIQGGYAIAGICLIRLEQIRPALFPFPIGFSSENAAHRVAVSCGESEEAVFVPRRDSNSWFNYAVGSRLFPGQYHRATFNVLDDLHSVELQMESRDGAVSLQVSGSTTKRLPENSVFESLEQSSRFFERGSLGYSATLDPARFDAMALETRDWQVAPLEIASVSSSYFADAKRFPTGSVSFDHALVMRNIRHEWRAASELFVEQPAN